MLPQRLKTTRCLWVVLLSTGWPCASAAEANLVKNGGFEIDADGNGRPDGWHTAGGPEIEQTITLDKGRDGGKSARLTCTKFVPDSGPPHVMICQVREVAVTKGKTYRLSFWAKQEDMDTGTVSFGLRDMADWQGCGLSQMLAFPLDASQWQKFTFLFQATRDCSKTSRLQFWHKQTGSFWLDDIELVQVKGSGRLPGHVLPTDGCRNRIPNSSFECGTHGWGSLTLSALSWGGGLDGLIGEIDSSQAAHGTRSMKIALTPDTLPRYDFDYLDITHAVIRGPLLGTIGWARVQKRKEHVLSVHLKSRRAGLVARLGVCQFPWRPITQTVTVADSWQRHSIVVKPQTDYCFVMVGPDLSASGREEGTLWVDRVQLEEGAKGTDYEPSHGVELGLATEKVGNVFFLGQPVRLTLSVHNSTRETQDVSCDVRVADFADREAERKTLSWAVPARSTHDEDVALVPGRAGFFRVRATMSWSGGRTEQTMRMAVIPRYEASDSVFGVNHAYGRPHLLRLCRAAGVTWFRDWSLKWKEVESVKGEFDFSRTDREIDRILAEEVNVLGLLPFPSSNWSSSAPASVKTEGSYQARRARLAYAPRDAEEFKGYVRRTVEHYRDRIRHWQIFNEPLNTGYSLPRKHGYESRDYAHWIEHGWAAAKEADPRCRVLIGFAGLSPLVVKEFEGIFEAGAFSSADILTVHTYPRVSPPEHVERPLQALNELMDRHGERKPIWLTEHGYYCDDDPAVVPPRTGRHTTPLPNERIHAEYSVKFNVVLLANGVKKIFYHSGRCSRLNRDNFEGILFEYGGTPRKIYAAVAALAHLLSPRPVFIKRLALDEGTRAYLFRQASRLVLVAWRPKPGQPPRLVLNDSSMTARDLMSNPIASRAVALTPTPVYVAASSLTVNQFEAGLQVER